MSNRFTFDPALIQKAILVSRIALYFLCLGVIFSWIFSFVTILEGLVLVLLSTTTLLIHYKNPKKLTTVINAILLTTISVLILLSAVNTFFLLELNSEFKISIVSLTSFTIAAFSIGILSTNRNQLFGYFQSLSIANIVLALSTIFSYIFGSDLLQSDFYFGKTSFAVAVHILVFSLGFLMLQPTCGWMPIIFADNMGGKQLRNSTLLAFPILAVTAIFASLGNRIGLYDFQYAFDIIVVSSFIIFGFALFFTTLSLNRNDRERQLALDELKLKEFDLMEAQKLAHVGIWSLEVDTMDLKFSPEMYRIHELSEDTPITLEFIERFFVDDDLQNIRRQIQNCIEHDSMFDIQHVIKCLNGTEKTVHARAKTRTNRLTGKKEIHGTLHDITDFNNTLLELDEAKKMYSDLYNEAPDMLLSVDPNTGIILKCNNTLLKNLGYELQEVIGSHITKFYTAESNKQLPELTENFIKTGFIHNLELTVLKKDGNPIDVSLSSTLVRGKNGEIIKSRSTWRNISNVKMARELEIRKRAAEESSRLKSNFVATISHEIRTPLNGVIGMSEVLMSTKLSSEQYDIVDTIKQSANTLFFLVNDILDFSKIESGKMNLIPNYFYLPILVTDIEKQIRWAAFKKDLNISFSLTGGDNLKFYGDRNRIQQILTNLISNAIKFTEYGRIDVKISVITINVTHSKIFFEVHDTGIGISENNLTFLFKPFYQLDSSLSRPSGGTGLGLSISQTLAELMSSKIQVKSELGKGSCFYFDIQLEHQIQINQNLTNPAHSILKFEKHPRILVAEDIDTNQKVLGSILGDLGCHFSFANNGEEALALLQENYFDAVLMDCQMPKLDGLEAVKLIRQLPGEISKIPVIAITAHAGSEDRALCLEAGMSDYISKPFTKSILSEVLNKWLKSSTKNQSLVDERILLDLKSLNSVNSTDLIKETISIFERNFPHRISNIKQFLEVKNKSEARASIHTLKSAASAFGGLGIANVCNSMADDVDHDRFSDALIKTMSLPIEVQNAKDYINNWLLAQSS